MRYTAFISHSARKAVGVLMLLLLLGVQVGCRAVYEDPQAPLAVDANMRLLFAVPLDTKSTTTQSYDDPANQEGMDNAIDARDLEVYFFTEAGAYITSVSGPRNLEVEPYSSGSYNPHYHMYAANMKVEGVVNGQRCRVVVVAHRRSWQNSFLPFCVPADAQNSWLTSEGSTDEERLYNSLCFNFSSTGGIGAYDYARYNYSKASDVTVPMWGFNTLNLRLATIDAYGYHDSVEPSGQIDLLRSIAKVKIKISSELLEYVNVTDFNKTQQKGGISLHSRMKDGYMTPAYAKVSSLSSTPDILNKDKTGGVPSGTYTNEWINQGASNPAPEGVYPFYLASDGCYYIYLPEHKIGQSWMDLEFSWKDPAFVNPVSHEYKLHFADYEQAMTHYGLPSGVALSEEQLEGFKYPVMRNHYYIYTIMGLNPMELKFEVCEWQYRSTEIEFN